MPYENKENQKKDQEEKQNPNRLIGSKRIGKIDKKQKGYDAQLDRWDRIEKWRGAKVTVWISPTRASALWLYAKQHKLPLLPTEVLYHVLDGLGADQGEPPRFVQGAHDAPGQELISDLHERLDRMDASTNEALTAISTLLLELLRQQRSDVEEPNAPAIAVSDQPKVEMADVPVRQWLESLDDSAIKGKASLVVAALVLPKTVALAQGSVACQVSAIQINGQRVAAQSKNVLLPSLTVHTAVKKEPSGSTLLIARLKANTWSIELAAVSADGKQKSTLSNFEI